MKPLAEMTPDEIRRAEARSFVMLDCLARGLPLASDPAILDRAAAVFRAADPAIRARTPRRQTAT